ncbi:MAG: hypothetical protein WDO73_19875 [Ignavibacteriota bacterium]
MATLVATFQTQYRLTTRAIPAGGGSVLPASGTYFDAGTSVNVNATATAPLTCSRRGAAMPSQTANPLSARHYGADVDYFQLRRPGVQLRHQFGYARGCPGRGGMIAGGTQRRISARPGP